MEIELRNDDALRFFCDATRFFRDAVRFFYDASRHNAYVLILQKREPVWLE
jgi:hypothetical protein